MLYVRATVHENGVASIGVVNQGQKKCGTRGEITEYSESSRRRLLGWLSLCKPSYTYMVTLTVPHLERDGALFKRRLDEMLKWYMQGSTADEQKSLTWFLEFQERGSPHVHAITNIWRDKGLVAKKWASLWPEQDTEAMVKASTRVEFMRSRGKAAAYAAKYGAKMSQKLAPPEYRNVGRFWGIRGWRERVAAATGSKAIYDGPLSTNSRGQNVELATFWLLLMRFLEDKNAKNVVHWKMGVGLSIFPSEDSPLFAYALTDFLKERGLDISWQRQPAT